METFLEMNYWQHLLTQAQELATSMPETGLNPDKLAHVPYDHLVGITAYLKGRKSKNSQD